MKKVWIALLLAVLLLLVSCGGNGDAGTTVAPSTTEAPATTSAPVATAVTTAAPSNTEAPATTETPATTEAPATTSAPETTEAPATAFVPATTAAPATAAETTAAPQTTSTPQTTEPVPETLVCSVRLTPFDGPVSILNAAEAAYLSDGVASATDYAVGKEELSRPNPVVLRWNVDFTSGENDLRYFVLSLWTKSDKSDAREYIVGRSERAYAFYNAYAGQTYCWQVTAHGVGGATFVSDAGSFVTADANLRTIYVDGVTNVRDLGGRATEDGGRIRQGLLFRGAQLDQKGKALITDAGIKTMLQTLGIKTELDLRTETEAGGITASVLGDGVNYYRRPLSGKFAPDDTLKSNLKKVFAYLADESNYPIYYHCAAGADRTGLVSWFVNGLCGVSEDDLWRDYLLTNFADVGGDRTKSKIQNAYVKTLKNTAGDTYAEKVYNYLKDEVGVPEEQLNAVIRILKAEPGETVQNTMPTVAAGHTHTLERTFTLIEGASCSFPGIKVRYCSVCGDFVSSMILETPIDPDAHSADWNVLRQPTVLDQTHGSRNGTCFYCGQFVEQTVPFSPTVLSFSNKSGGKYIYGKIPILESANGDHFYPAPGNLEGNDLLIEYSVFYNRTMQSFDTESGDPYITARISSESILYWSPADNVSSSWCPYAGGFEGTGENFIIPVSDGSVTTPEKMVEKDGTYADYPNIGGSKRTAPEYGWHRIGIRIHEEVTNVSELRNDTVAGKTPATYVVTLTVYFDGVPAYKLKTEETETGMAKKENLLFTASSDGKGRVVYSDIAADRYVIPFQLNDTTAKSGASVYLAIADVSVSCGKDFVQQVEKLETPTPSTVAVTGTYSLSAPIYYTLAD